MKTVFTNGCFDLLHKGHVELLRKARGLGDRLVVGINSDRSVKAIKGASRPINSEADRKAILEALDSVDEVIIFDELTPYELIKRIKPDVLVKGGDWAANEIVGSDVVRELGGEVRSIPLVNGYSTTAVVEKMSKGMESGMENDDVRGNSGAAEDSIRQHLDVFGRMLKESVGSIEACAELIVAAIKGGKKVLLCGNGGSAADAQHIAAEFVGRYESERIALPAIALTTDTSALTALSNDYGYEHVFRRQVEALAREGDVLVAISTSGNSPNVISAMMKARELGCRIVGLTGAKGGKFAALCDSCVIIPSERTSRIQEGHIAVGHIWCQYLDESLSGEI